MPHLSYRTPYPLALQGIITLVALATLFDAFEAASGFGYGRFLILCGLIMLLLLVSVLAPMRRMADWQQLACLVGQCGLVTLAHLALPAPMLTYVYLIVVLQAIYLLFMRVWLWSLFAGFVWLVWSGMLIIASSNLLDWLRNNLVIAFPTTCILIAAILYARQHHRGEQVQQVLQQMQRQYDALKQSLGEAQQSITLEERRRLAQTLVSDIEAALAQTEQQVAAAIHQAQTNFARLHITVAQTRAAASHAIERLRSAIASLRQGDQTALMPVTDLYAPAFATDDLLTVRAFKVLTWTLPLIFVGIAFSLTLLHQPIAPDLIWKFSLFGGMLVVGHLFTPRIHHPVLVHAGLLTQASGVLALVLMTHMLPLILGLLLVLWQIALRVSAIQLITLFAGLQTLIGVLLVRLLPIPGEYATNLLVFCVACVAVAGLVGMARRQLSRRRQDEARLTQLARLTRELEQQVVELRTLAIVSERARLAREFHDDLGHQLVLINVQLQIVEDMIADDPNAAVEQLLATREQLRAVWLSVPAAVDALLPLNGQTLQPALQALVSQCQSSTTTRIDLQISGSPVELSADAACTVYRAVQEGLTNACKYAQAHNIYVHVGCVNAQASVSVRDDGCGGVMPRSEAAQGTHGFGLIGLRERATLLGGYAEAGPLPGGGFALHLCIPLGEKAR